MEGFYDEPIVRSLLLEADRSKFISPYIFQKVQTKYQGRSYDGYKCLCWFLNLFIIICL